MLKRYDFVGEKSRHLWCLKQLHILSFCLQFCIPITIDNYLAFLAYLQYMVNINNTITEYKGMQKSVAYVTIR